jgi:F0F1-type ATP synthase assembly protein I
MGFFKPSHRTVSSKSIARLQALTWVLIYGGLLALVLGLFVDRVDDDTDWFLMVGGALAAVVGFALIYVRSKIKGDS